MYVSHHDGFVVASASAVMPDGLAELAAEAERDGVHNVARLIALWADGTERYSRPGESLRLARSLVDDRVVGVGGIARCPDLHGAFRVRRFFVSVDWRRRGVARALALGLLADAAPHTDRFTCNAKASAASPVFWEVLGFVPVEMANVTHVRPSSMT